MGERIDVPSGLNIGGSMSLMLCFVRSSALDILYRTNGAVRLGFGEPKRRSVWRAGASGGVGIDVIALVQVR